MKIQPSEFIKQTRDYLANLNLNPKKQSESKPETITEAAVYPLYYSMDMVTGIQTPQEQFIKLCKTMNFENYNSSDENLQKGIFQIDLHSHSNYSDGWADVKNC